MLERFQKCSACAVALFILLAIGGVYADDFESHPDVFLAHVSVSILSTAGGHGSGGSTSDMVFASFGPDGWGWSGGAGAVQGSSALHYNSDGTTSPIIAANEAFKFNVGPVVDSLNAQYGAGHWTIANPRLTLASSYAAFPNSRFGQGAGSFAIFWVANNDWAQSAGTPGDTQLNPAYAASKGELSDWAGDLSLLGREFFANQGIEYVKGQTTTFVNLAYELAPSRDFVDDILSASATGPHQTVSLYLMATDTDLGMLIFTGGPGFNPQPLPTLSFDVAEAHGHSHHSE